MSSARPPWRLRGRLGKQTSAIFEPPHLQDARKRLEALQEGLGRQMPEAMECLRSTNGLERLHSEVKRRIRSVGAFPDRASALRLITAVALETTGVWDDRRYLDMSLLKSNPIIAA